MIAFIDDHRALYGVEPICKVLPDCSLDLPLRFNCPKYGFFNVLDFDRVPLFKRYEGSNTLCLLMP